MISSAYQPPSAKVATQPYWVYTTLTKPNAETQCKVARGFAVVAQQVRLALREVK